jgi:hypothetical protein
MAGAVGALRNRRMSNGESTARKHRGLKEPWQPGQSGNPACRPRGARNRLGEAFLADLYDDWLENGVEAIQRVCRDRPQDYLKIIASILPRDLNVRVNELEDVSDDDLIARIRELDRHVRPFLDSSGPGDKMN